MVDELYPGYDPLIDPNPITCWGHPTAEELEADAKRRRETIPYYEILWVLNEWMWKEAWAEAKAEQLLERSVQTT
jgi:hypothetical protein